MQRQNTIIIGLVSALIIISMSVSVNSEFRHKIRQFIGDDTSKYYLQTINISKSDSTEIGILTHTIVKLNNNFIGHSRHDNKLIIIDSEIDLSSHVNSYTQNCSTCHQ